MLKLPRSCISQESLSFLQTKPEQIKELLSSQMPTGSYVGFSSGESHCVTGRQRWELGEDLLDASEAIICSFHTVSLLSRVFLPLPFVRSCFLHAFLPLCFHPYVLNAAELRSRWGSFLFLTFIRSLTTNVVQKGDIDCASLKRENKHHYALSYTVTKGNISFPCTVLDANETRVYRLTKCERRRSCTDGTMSLHDGALFLFTCQRVHAGVTIVAPHGCRAVTHM